MKLASLENPAHMGCTTTGWYYWPDAHRPRRPEHLPVLGGNSLDLSFGVNGTIGTIDTRGYVQAGLFGDKAEVNGMTGAKGIDVGPYNLPMATHGRRRPTRTSEKTLAWVRRHHEACR